MGQEGETCWIDPNGATSLLPLCTPWRQQSAQLVAPCPLQSLNQQIITLTLQMFNFLLQLHWFCSRRGRRGETSENKLGVFNQTQSDPETTRLSLHLHGRGVSAQAGEVAGCRRGSHLSADLSGQQCSPSPSHSQNEKILLFGDLHNTAETFAAPQEKQGSWCWQSKTVPSCREGLREHQGEKGNRAEGGKKQWE